MEQDLRVKVRRPAEALAKVTREGIQTPLEDEVAGDRIVEPVEARARDRAEAPQRVAEKDGSNAELLPMIFNHSARSVFLLFRWFA
jgi:hypothetical protein